MRKAFAIFAFAMVFVAADAYSQCGNSQKRFSVTAREVAAGNEGEFRLLAEVSGGDAPFTYRWKAVIGGEEFTSTERITPIFRPYFDRYAEVIVTDRGGCTAQATYGKLVALPKKGCTTLAYSPVPTAGAVQSTGLAISFSGQGVEWRVALENRGLKGVALGRVDMKRPNETTWNTILKSAGPVEIFVPYHNGTTRLYDMQYCANYNGNFHPCLRQVNLADTAPQFGNPAQLITFPGSPYPTVAAECRDEGLAALCKTNAGNVESGSSARYKELVLWSVYDTGNYDYVVQYAFRNDGTIRFRLGATGYNNQMHPDDPHMHNVLWRVDADLFGAKGDHVEGFVHSEPPSSLTATDYDVPYGYESTIPWNDASFTSLLLQSGNLNAHGNEMGYELSPWDRKGTSKHYGAGENWTREDFWITVNNPGEDGTGTGPNSWGSTQVQPDSYVMQYVTSDASLNPSTGPQPLLPTSDIVVWYRSAAHHHPRDEDRRDSDTGASITGLTLMHWQGFDFEPHNVFTHNPVLPTNSCFPN